MKRYFSDPILYLTIMYSLIYALGLQFFIIPASLITTGLAGVAQIIEYILGFMDIQVSYGIMYFLLNIPGLLISYKYIGKKFTYYTLSSVIAVTLFTSFIDPIFLTDNMILNCIFGGIIMGYGIGGLLKIGTSSGGLDIYGVIYYQLYGTDFKKFNNVINGVIVAVGILVFAITDTGINIDIEIGLYTILSIYFRNHSLGMIFTNHDKVTVWIIGSDLSNVSKYINIKLKHGTTLMPQCEGGFSHDNKQMLMTILNKYEYSQLMDCIYELCPDAFVNVTDTHKVNGNYKIIKRTT